MRILIYGGSFNPPHLGHIRSVQTAVKALAPDKTFLIPAAIPPHKRLAQGSPEPEHRLVMTALAAEAIPGCAASDMELRREGLSYTSDTLRQLHERYPDAELVFLMGTDMLLSLETWHEPETIMALSSLAVFARETGREGEISAQAAHLREKYGAAVYMLEGEPVTVSSTEIRELLPQRQGRGYLTDGVYAYIIRHRLYGARPDLDWLREKAYAYLKSTRVEHVRGTEAMARRLAVRWGVDETDAAEAAILHDVTKKMTGPDQLRLAEKYGIIPDTWERENTELLHAVTGAAFAADIFGVPEPIENAIRWHTTGRPGMTALEQIVFLADAIEMGRKPYPALEAIRKTAFEDLDAAVELCARRTLDYVAARGLPIHPDTARTREYYLKKLEDKGVSPVQVDGGANE